MRKFLFCAAALLAVAAPAVALADTTGNIALSFSELDDSIDSFKEDSIELSGSVAANVGNSWTVQFDAVIADWDHTNHSHNNSTGTVHAFTRMNNYAVGGFGGYTGGGNSANYWFIGAEGAYYFDRVTVGGAALIGTNRAQDDTDVNGAQLHVTYFVNDNLSVGGEVYVANQDIFTSEIETTGYGANVEYQFDAHPISVFANYRSLEQEFNTTPINREVDGITLGVRWNFGGQTLYDRDRMGGGMRGGDWLNREMIASS